MKGIDRMNLLQKLIEEEKAKYNRLEQSFISKENSWSTEIERVSTLLRSKSQEFDDMRQRASMVELQVG
jgi:hypothetical protein